METKSFCPFCGDPLGRKFVEGNHRLFCSRCNRPIYENPIPATCVIVSDDHARLVLVKRSVPPKKGWWCLPGGFIELGEDPEAGALRELAEETGLIAVTASLMGVCTTPSPQYHSVLMISYAVTEFHGRLNPGDDASEARWFPHDRLPAIAFDSHEHFIGLFFDRKSFPAAGSSLKNTPHP